MASAGDADKLPRHRALTLPTDVNPDFPQNRLRQVGPTLTVGPTTFTVADRACHSRRRAGDVIEMTWPTMSVRQRPMSTNTSHCRCVAGQLARTLRSTGRDIDNTASGWPTAKGWVPHSANNVVVE